MSLSWVIMEKEGQQYKYSLYNNSHLFNRDLMNIQIEGWNMDVFLTFDDIICIKTENFYPQERRIEELPKGLIELQIRFANIVELPVFPPNIKKIQMFDTGVVLDEDKMLELQKMYPDATITISSVPSMKREVAIPTYYRFTHINDENDENDEISRYTYDSYSDYSFNGDDDDDDDFFNMDKHVLNNKQTVHLTSINQSVMKSIEVIFKESEKYPPIYDPVEILFEEINGLDEITLKFAIKEWIEKSFEVKEITFCSLFTQIMKIVHGQPNEETRKNMKIRIKTELYDAIDKCFMGRINRLVSSMASFINDVEVYLSAKEELQMKSLLIINRLNNLNINIEQAREQMVELLEQFEEKDGITEQIKKEYLLALDELQ